MKKWDRNHVKLQNFIIFRWLKDKLGLQLRPRLHQLLIYSDKLQNLVNIFVRIS